MPKRKSKSPEEAFEASNEAYEQIYDQVSEESSTAILDDFLTNDDRYRGEVGRSVVALEIAITTVMPESVDDAGRKHRRCY